MYSSIKLFFYSEAFEIKSGIYFFRYNGQCIIHLLMSHEDFDRMLKKNIPPNSLRNVQDKIDMIRRKVKEYTS